MTPFLFACDFTNTISVADDLGKIEISILSQLLASISFLHSSLSCFSSNNKYRKAAQHALNCIYFSKKSNTDGSYREARP